MYLQPLQAMQDSQVCISGDVTIHPSAAIAPGVLLLANEGSKIVIGAGVCVGMGAVLHASEGVLEIQEGASLGAGVLWIGSGMIGNQACIGASSTIFNTSVAAQTLVPSGSLLGDHTQQVPVEASLKNMEAAPAHPVSPPQPEQPIEDLWAVEVTEQEVIERKNIKVVRKAEENSDAPKTSNSVHGKAYVNDLLSTLLPNRSNQISPS
jgi:carbon dioxide concentrating mechanism protein CcmN